jgi:hypothetical protein
LRHHILLLAMLVSVIVGCQAEDQARPSSTKQRSGSGGATTNATFEVRDFQLEKDEGSSNTWTSWRGRGNLVTKAPEVQDKTIMVFLEYRDTRDPSQKPTQVSAVVRDGIGLVETYDLITEAPQYEWVIHGWIPLNPASLTNAAAPGKQ